MSFSSKSLLPNVITSTVCLSNLKVRIVHLLHIHMTSHLYGTIEAKAKKKRNRTKLFRNLFLIIFQKIRILIYSLNRREWKWKNQKFISKGRSIHFEHRLKFHLSFYNLSFKQYLFEIEDKKRVLNHKS